MASRGDRLLKFQRSGWSGDFKECKDEKNVWDDNFYELNRKHLELEREKLSDAKKSEPHPLDLCLTDNARETRGLNKIKRFCSSVDYKNVENPLPDAVKPLDALVKSAAVDERYLTESGKLEPVVSGLSSPLTPNGLLRRLKERHPTCSKGGRRRLVYVQDLLDTPEYVYSLLLSSSTLEIKELRGALFRHVERKASLQAATAFQGHQRFVLQFDLPGVVLEHRSEEDQRDDDVDMSFLGLKDPEAGKEGNSSKLLLRGTQASCLIVGVDDHSYTAFGLMSDIDDELDEDAGPVPILAPSSGDIGEMTQAVYAPDYISGSGNDMEIPLSDARRYFLSCLSNRLERITEQWDLIVGKLKDAFTEQMKNHRSSAMEQSATRSKKTEYLSWAERYCEVLNFLIETLDDLVRREEPFRTRYVPNFFNEDDMTGPIALIERDFVALREILRELQNLRKRCESHTSDLKSQMSAWRTVIFEQSGNTTRFTVLFLPIILTTAIFGMEPNAIPFEKKPRAVVGVFVGLALIVILLERIFYSDLLHPWKRACIRAIQKRLPSIFNINSKPSHELDSPQEVDASVAIEHNASATESSATSALADPEAGVRVLVKGETMRTLVNA